MNPRAITYLTWCAIVFTFSFTAQAVRVDLPLSLEYDTPTTGGYRWNVIRIVSDTAPKPGTAGHDANFPIKNSEGWSVYFVEHIHFAVTSTPVDPLVNGYADILYTHYDFDEEQVETINWNFDQMWASSNIYPVPIRVGNASIAYNCFAYALNYTNIAINDIRFYTLAYYFPSGVPDWRTPLPQEQADRAGHGNGYREHASILSGNIYIGKYGECGVYESVGKEAPEYCFQPKTKKLKLK